MAHHRAEPNQTLAELVAAKAPHLDVSQVRDDEKNAGLFAARDEYMLNPGDPVWIPDEEPSYQWHQVGPGETLTLEIEPALRPFKLALSRPNRAPLANEAFTLQINGESFDGNTDADGALELELPFDATDGVIQVGNLRRNITIGGLDPIHSVKGFQARLANMGFEPGTIDGWPGPKTTGAIEAFQAYLTLEETGVMDAETRKALLEEYGC